MRVLFVLGILAGLGSCADPVQDAKDELAIVENTSGITHAEVCDAKRKVAEAHLKAKDDKGYRDSKLSADITCRLSGSNRALGLSDERRPTP